MRPNRLLAGHEVTRHTKLVTAIARKMAIDETIAHTAAQRAAELHTYLADATDKIRV